MIAEDPPVIAEDPPVIAVLGGLGAALAWTTSTLGVTCSIALAASGRKAEDRP